MTISTWPPAASTASPLPMCRIRGRDSRRTRLRAAIGAGAQHREERRAYTARRLLDGWHTGLGLRDRIIAGVGTGRIGRRTIEIAREFGMRVVAFDQVQDAAAATRLGFTYGPLDEVLAQADVVTRLLLSSPSTVGLLGERQFAAMKDRAILINAARCNVVDSEALVRALANGKLRAAGLDVLPQEPLIREEAEIFRQDKTVHASDLKALVANHVLLRFPDVLVTPHNAYNTDTALARIMETTITNVEGFAAGRAVNQVQAAA